MSVEAFKDCSCPPCRYLEHEIFQEDSDILFIDPAVVSCMVHQCDGEHLELR